MQGINIQTKINCKLCGYVGSQIHSDIYDCCDYTNPIWMKVWLGRMKISEKKKPYISNFVKWAKT